MLNDQEIAGIIANYLAHYPKVTLAYLTLHEAEQVQNIIIELHRDETGEALGAFVNEHRQSLSEYKAMTSAAAERVHEQNMDDLGANVEALVSEIEEELRKGNN